ncbi:MAG TPA: heavy-metal-associated domain-containing protein [Chromatiaceae bacterium]|nr:heavy-metal-associated domain-containing protein [Chromatiaceae bacterium]
MMYKILLLLFAGLLAAQANAGEVVEIDVHGMTCGFCVDAVQRNLRKLPDVEKAEVSLKLKKVRIHAKDNGLDIDRVRKTILDSGFTPIDVKRLDEQ